jgi:L-asparaginase / beta-aspartyl-peptidase
LSAIRMDKKIAITIHGGASEDTEFIRSHLHEYENSLGAIVAHAYKLLERGASAIDSVEEAVKALEDNELFNSGRGSAFNEKAEVEMDACIMEGTGCKSGSVALVKTVKNPISLARAIMEKTKSIFLAGNGAIEFAKHSKLTLESEAYFHTVHQYNEYQKERDKRASGIISMLRMHGTVGAVALDKNGHLASAVSTGGTIYQHEGRVSDSAIVGAGCYANDKTCAVAVTGDGEYIIRSLFAHNISILMKNGGYSIQEACNQMIAEAGKDNKADLGVIAIDPYGNIAIAFNTEQMRRAWISAGMPLKVGVYR